MIKTTLYSQEPRYEHILLIKKKYENLKVDSNTIENNYMINPINTSVYLDRT